MATATKELLGASFPDFGGLPKPVQAKMAKALKLGAEIKDVPDGKKTVKKIVFPEDAGGRSLSRLEFVGTWREQDMKTFEVMPWKHFEATKARRVALERRVGLKVSVEELGA
jgi:hypothetical protein